jgi:phenylpropionate dioxygenase-like ring-hydroxylating dioxygenase large terminal subunit
VLDLVGVQVGHGYNHRMAADEQLAMLVQADRVHRSVYADPAIFELEMERIFGRAWLCSGTRARCQAPGDYFTTRMGRSPYRRSSRQRDRVLINRCAHRGSMVCAEGRGNTERFVCPYHGWSYDRAGALQAVPFRGRVSKEKLRTAARSRVPRVATIAASSSPRFRAAGGLWRRFLGAAKASFDDFVDRAPGGELEVAGGVFKHAYNGNWKLMLENHLDGAHPAWVHASSVAVRAGAPEPGKPGEEHYYDIAVRQMRQNGAPSRSGKAPASGPRRAATATWATTTTTAAWCGAGKSGVRGVPNAADRDVGRKKRTASCASRCGTRSSIRTARS